MINKSPVNQQDSWWWKGHKNGSYLGKDILLIEWDLKSIKHWNIFFIKSSCLLLCLLGTLNTNESKRNIKAFDDLWLIVNSEKNTQIWGIIFVIKRQSVSAFIFCSQHVHLYSLFYIFTVMVILETIYITGFLKKFLHHGVFWLERFHNLIFSPADKF